jgi:transcriptional regulator with XRE-family HTH domain
MNLRVLREQKFLSQEKLAAMSGLSLRTIQRLEAGHRVSYASLRALAVALAIDVDSLEQELYAMSGSPDAFVEIPTWVRLLDGKRWFGGANFGRRDIHGVEIFCLACTAGNFAGCFLTASTDHARVFRNLGIITMACAYLASAMIRLGDRYKLWPGTTIASPARPRTWRTRITEYAYMLGVGTVGTALVYWVVFRS